MGRRGSSACLAHLPVSSRRVVLHKELVDGLDLIFLQHQEAAVVFIPNNILRPAGLFLDSSVLFLTPLDDVVVVYPTETECVD